MDLPKLVYDDFYKFLMSLGIILFTISLGIGILFANNLILNHGWIFISLGILIFISSIKIMICAGEKWYKNQRLLDRKLKAETELAERTTERMLKPEKELIAPEKEIRERTERVSHKGKFNGGGIALITYKIASVLPGTISFDFLKDWKVWFLLENHEQKKYKAYIKIKFISDGYEEEINEGYYGGAKAWNLNALSAVMAPGLGIPKTIKQKAEERKKIEIRIFCEVKDEDDKLIEKKLPVGYVYDYENKGWYYEP